jgi:hypothetical protein
VFFELPRAFGAVQGKLASLGADAPLDSSYVPWRVADMAARVSPGRAERTAQSSTTVRRTGQEAPSRNAISPCDIASPPLDQGLEVELFGLAHFILVIDDGQNQLRALRQTGRLIQDDAPTSHASAQDQPAHRRFAESAIVERVELRNSAAQLALQVQSLAVRIPNEVIEDRADEATRTGTMFEVIEVRRGLHKLAQLVPGEGHEDRELPVWKVSGVERFSQATPDQFTVAGIKAPHGSV